MALALLCIAQFVVVLDVTIVAVALPSIQRDLGFSTSDLQWVLTGYVLVFGGLLVPAGRAADLLGRRRMLAAGLTVFALASLACALAQSAVALVALRALQGLGAAMTAPAALALLVATFPGGDRRRRALAAWTAAAAGGGAAGWVLGGLLTQTLGWRAVFAVNVPIGLAAAVLVTRLLAESRGTRAPLDVLGALTVTAGLGLLVLGLTRMQTAGPLAPGALGALLLGGALLGAFAAIERRVAHPLLPPGALRARRFLAANAGALALTASTTPPVFLIVLHEQRDLGHGAIATGLACAPVNLAVIAGSLAGPRLVAAAGTRAVLGGGLVAVAAGALALAAGSLLGGLALMGAGLGAASVAATEAGAGALGDDSTGLASGLLNAAAQIGTALGLALLVGVATAHGTAAAQAGAALLAAVAAVLTWRLLPRGAASGLRPARPCPGGARARAGRPR
jgi:MFS family permease